MRTRSGLPVTLSFVAVLALTVWPLPAPAQDSDMAAAVAALEWREIGPTIMGGRISDIAVVESDPSTFYVGVATGGLWKTTDHGTTFESVFDDQPMLSIGDVTVAPSNSNVVWVGSGEPQNRQSSPWGMGVFRSMDAGRSWTHLGLEETHHIARIRIHPRNPDVAYVAAMGHLWGSNPERGVYRTTDGGETWELVLYVDEHTGAIDLAMDPGDPMTLFAAMYQRQRKVWGFNGGGPGSGLYRTTDSGDTWTRLAGGLPEGDLGRIGIDIYRRDGNLVMAIVEADKRAPGQVDPVGGRPDDPDRKTGIYKSTDRGESWTQVSTTNNRPMYYSQIRIDPNDPERVYLGGRDLYRSSDGGHTFTPDAAAEVHPDHHALWINPTNSDHLILGGDGGVAISWSRSDSWRQLRNLPLAQFYEIDVDDRDPYHVCGGLQDNGSWCAPSETWSDHGIRSRDWYNVGMSDGYFTVLHPSGETMLVEAEDGRLMRSNLKTGERLWIRPLGPAGDDGGPPEYRWNWNTPIEASPSDPNTIYIGGNTLFRSTDYGQTWEQISPDLTKDIDRGTLEIMGVPGSEPMLSANDGTTSFGSLTAIEASPVDAMVVYVGTDDGNLQVTRDGGATWTNTSPNMPGAPDQLYMTRIVASHADAGTVWVAGDQHRNDDMAPYLYVSNNFGESWRAVTNGLPDGWSLNALAQHPRAASLLFAGNEIGTYFSIDAGNSWHPLLRNMPPAPVDDIKIQARENDLVIGTHGRGIWIMEDITPLEEMSEAVLASDVHLFSVQSAVAYNLYRPQSFTPGVYAAENPPPGARIRYWLGSDLPEASGADEARSATVTILNGAGDVLRMLEGGGTRGLHELMWDLRLQPVPATLGGGDFYRPAATAPRVLPGTYTARLDAAGRTLETSLTVRLDPRLDIGPDELTARQNALMRAYALAQPTNEGLQAATRLRGHLSDVAARLADHAAAESLTAEVEAIGAELDAIGEALAAAHTGADVSGQLSAYHTAPTADMLYQIERGWDTLPGAVDRLNALIEDRMPALYSALQAAGIHPHFGDPIAAPVPPMR